MSSVDVQEIDLILGHLQEQTGLDFFGNYSSMIGRRLRIRMSKTGQQSYQDYSVYLQQNNDELAELLDSLTISVTSFYRDPFTFEFIYEHVLPHIFEEKGKSRDATLRIWCAGCSTGEEAYSMAILLKEMKEKHPDSKIAPSIFATDIDQHALEAAQAGRYNLKSVWNVKQGQVSKYFKVHGESFEINTEIKKLVEFSTFDMLSDLTLAPPDSIFGGFDIVLCRNLLIYFTAEYQVKIMTKLYESLNLNGVLILGKTERPLDPYKLKFVEENSRARIYRKVV